MRLHAAFTACCALAVPAWWVLLFESPTFREAFVPAAAWAEFQHLLVPDLVLAAACAVVAVGLARGRRPRIWLGAVCGGWGYATAFSIAWAAGAEAPWLGPLLMIMVFLGLVVVAHALVPARAPRQP